MKQPVPAYVPTPEDENLANEVSGLLQKLKDRYSEYWYKKFVEIAYEVGVVGVTLEEACMLQDVEYETFLDMQSKDQNIKRLIVKKTLEYKRNLLKSVSHAAKSNDKVALELLMSRYPDEFNKRKGSSGDGDGETNNFINMAVNFVQTNGDKKPIINLASGKAEEQPAEITEANNKRTKEERETIMKRLSKMLI